MSWYDRHGPDQDVIVSTRVRLARNIKGHAFPHLLKEQEREDLIQEIADRVRQIDPVSFHLVRRDDLTDIDRLSLAEHHIINPMLLKSGQDHGLMINDQEDLSILLLDEDHLRVQSIAAGFRPDDVFDRAKKLATALESVLDIAKDKNFGYLTACPTNVGTGLRISVLFHAAGLNRLGQLKYLIDSLRRSGYTVRGYYGEGSQDQGQMIQVSNQVTLGQSDFDMVKKFSALMQVVIDKERNARKAWYDQEGIQLKDKIYRSKAILENAYLVGHNEAFACLSDLRLGRALGFEAFPDYPDILALSYLAGVGSIQKQKGKILQADERDAARAELIKERLLRAE